MIDNLELTGTVEEKFFPVERNEKFKTQEIVVHLSKTLDDGRVIDNYVTLQAINKSIDYLQNINRGDKVKVNFSIGGKKHEKNFEFKYFNTLTLWRIEKVS